jgi:hypothetical protein
VSDERGASTAGIIIAVLGLLAAGLGLVEALYRTDVIQGPSPVERVVDGGNDNVDADAPRNDDPPSIAGEPLVGNTLTANEGDWDPDPDDISYQWLRCLDECSAIEGATGETYLISDGDAGTTIQVAVTATNENGSNEETSEATDTVEGSPAPEESPGE